MYLATANFFEKYLTDFLNNHFLVKTDFVPTIMHTAVIVSCADRHLVKAKVTSHGHSHYC